jgi:hypothetical protein
MGLIRETYILGFRKMMCLKFSRSVGGAFNVET